MFLKYLSIQKWLRKAREAYLWKRSSLVTTQLILVMFCYHFIISQPGVTEKAVFKRLGGSAEPGKRAAVKRAATSTQPDECEPIARDAAPYIGVLKDGGVHAKSPKRLKIGMYGNFKRPHQNMSLDREYNLKTLELSVRCQ